MTGRKHFGGTLQGAGTVGGAYTNMATTTPRTVPVTGATSPGPEGYYRVAR